MSELVNARTSRRDLRWNLLTSVSALALLGFAYGADKTQAADDATDRPTVWIELGGQLEQVSGEGEAFAPAFIAAYSDSVIFHPVSPLQVQKPPKFATGAQSRISFEPAGTNWVFSGSILYGRSNGNKHVHNQTYTYRNPSFGGYAGALNYLEKFANTRSLHNEGHVIADFKAGKDVGLGMLGRDSKSTLSLGVRFAQFSSQTHVSIEARPDFHVTPPFFGQESFHDYTAMAQSRRSFHGLGPSLSWDASAPIVGSHDDAEIALDWGANAALLFGRQKVSEQHNTTARQHIKKYYVAPVVQTGNNIHARAVMVPNIGGFAGVSFNYAAAKVSLGYRGDFFFGAIDGGWDTAHKENLSFHGPYATLSVGLGG